MFKPHTEVAFIPLTWISYINTGSLRKHKLDMKKLNLKIQTNCISWPKVEHDKDDLQQLCLNKLVYWKTFLQQYYFKTLCVPI